MLLNDTKFLAIILKIYIENADITSNMLSIRFQGEEGFGEGVTRHLYSQFFKYVFRFKSGGLSAFVPISLNEDESIYFGKILTHCFIQWNTFPKCGMKHCENHSTTIQVMKRLSFCVAWKVGRKPKVWCKICVLFRW